MPVMSARDAPPLAEPLAAVEDAAPGGSVSCEACGAPLEPDDDFCPECGLELAAGRTLRRRRRVRLAAVAAVLLALLAAAATFGVLWRREASSGDRARGQLRTVSTQLAAQQRLNRELAATRVKLAQVERLAELRGGVLTQTRQAVKQVEPLLSSVDSLQRLTGQIQTSRNRFATRTAAVVDSLIAFSNAVLKASRAATRSTRRGWERRSTRSTRSSTASARATTRWTAATPPTSKASRRFENRATDFNIVIRKLQQQLQAVLEGSSAAASPRLFCHGCGAENHAGAPLLPALRPRPDGATGGARAAKTATPDRALGPAAIAVVALVLAAGA